MKKTLLISAVLAAVLATPLMAEANTYTMGATFDSTSINGMSLPAGKISSMQLFNGGYATMESATYGAGNSMDYFNTAVAAGKYMPFDNGILFAGVTGGYERLGYNMGHIAAAFAGARVGYTYQFSRDFAVGVDGAFGRDFATSATVDPNTVGGLFYQAGASADFINVGPGVFSVSYQYRHMPISESSNLHLNTKTYGIGYHVSF